jgi:hypothetical protein
VTVYRVIGGHAYREHAPTETFEAVLPTDVEARAIGYGAIEIVERSTPRIQPGSYRLPDGWTANHPHHKED